MASKSTKEKPTFHGAANRRGSTSISPQAMLAWNRVPAQSKVEILATFKRGMADNDVNVKTVKIGTQMLKVRRMSSGFRVVYESGTDHDTIISVLTPREALFGGA